MTLSKLSKIYIVDDTAHDRTMMKDFLSKYPNAAVKEFQTGDACIKEIVSGPSGVPDLVIIDYFLEASFVSKYDGLDTLVKIKEICPETKVAMFTSVENPRIIELAKEKGALDYIVKGTEGFNKLSKLISSNFDLN